MCPDARDWRSLIDAYFGGISVEPEPQSVRRIIDADEPVSFSAGPTGGLGNKPRIFPKCICLKPCGERHGIACDIKCPGIDIIVSIKIQTTRIRKLRRCRIGGGLGSSSRSFSHVNGGDMSATDFLVDSVITAGGVRFIAIPGETCEVTLRRIEEDIQIDAPAASRLRITCAADRTAWDDSSGRGRSPGNSS